MAGDSVGAAGQRDDRQLVIIADQAGLFDAESGALLPGRGAWTSVARGPGHVAGAE